MKLVWFIPAVALALLAASCSSSEDGAVEAADTQTEAPLAITMAKVEQRPINRTMDVVGSLEARDKVDFSFEVPGRLQEINVDFGKFVRAGDVVARLDPREFDLRVDRTKASLAQALAQLGLPPDGDPQNVKATPAGEQARAQLEDAQSKYESAQTLVESGDISKLRFIELQKSVDARKAALEATQDELRRQQAQIGALQADLALAERDRDETVLRAPFAGEILQKLASPGQFLKENTPVATLVRTRPLRLRALVPETAAGAIRPGQSVRFTTDAFPAESFTGTITELSPSLDPQARTLEVEARVDDSDSRLRPGMFAKLSIVVAQDVPVVMAPREAIYEIAGLAKVFVVENGEIQELRIRKGIEHDGWVVIEGDSLQPGATIAVSHLAQLHNGRKVTKG